MAGRAGPRGGGRRRAARPWPDVGAAVGRAAAGRADAASEADRGVVCCWTGTGVSIAANKIPGVRAPLCTDRETAVGARRWNDANVPAFGLRLTTEAMAEDLVEAFLPTDVGAGEGALIDKLERRATPCER